MAKTEVFKPDSVSASVVGTTSAAKTLASAADATKASTATAPAAKELTSMADALVSQTKMAMAKVRVVTDDTPLWRIATDNGVSIRDLMELNHLTSVSVPEGASIKLP